MSLNFDQKYILREPVVFKKEDDGGFLFDPESGRLKYVNRTATTILDWIDGKTDLDGLLQALQHHYPDTAVETLRDDLAEFFQDLIANHFVSPAPPAK